MSASRLQFGVLALIGFSVHADAQASSPPAAQQLPIAAQIARSVRTSGNDGRALPILTQARRSERRALMDEIADTLAAIAINPSVNDLANARARSVAIGILFQSGKGNTGLADDVPGTPYSGATSRLRRIVELSSYVENRQVALKRLASLDHSSAMLGYLRQLALSSGRIAGTAVAILADDKGAGGRAIARELYVSGVVTDATAKRFLSTRANKYGW